MDSTMGSITAAGHQTMITRPVVSEQVCPIEVVSPIAEDGHTTTAVVRTPPGARSVPAVIHLHGGLEPRSIEWLREDVLSETLSRFLAAGYVTISATFRSRRHDPLTENALRDCLAVIAHVMDRPEVDGQSVCVWGDSGGGSLALELAGETELCAIACQEPASVLFTGMFSKQNLGGDPPYDVSRGNQIMASPRRFFTPELEAHTRQKIARIGCPVLIAHGDVHPINTINHEIVIPELRRAGKELEVILYPGEKHGFSQRGTPPATQKFFQDCHAFFERYLSKPPVPLEPALVQHAPVTREARAARGAAAE